MPFDAMRHSRVLLGSLLLVATGWAGCIGAVDEYYEFDPDPQYRNPGVFEGTYAQTGSSFVLVPGPHKPGLPEIVQLRSNRPAYPEQSSLVTTDGEVLITMAIWRPENVTAPIPIIVDAGPYYEIDQHCPMAAVPCPVPPVEDTIDWVGQTTEFSLKNFLPYGYAVVQLAVRGTGTHGGCMDLMGDDEVHDLNQAITWLGEQPWSNGNIAMMGVSYDASTPWEVAGTGNPYLKAIVPISGLPDIYDLMFHNGSAETRGAIMHNVVYWPFGFDDDFPQQAPDPAAIQLPVQPPVPLPVAIPGKPVVGQANGREPYQDMQNLLCEDAAKGLAFGPGASVTGGRMSEVADYWNERDHRDDVLNNYTGSVFLIHGLQDWNVDPHSAIPFNVALREKGLEVKEWYGQWGHARPDSSCSGTTPEWVTRPCRLDFAEVLLRWFERQLKGNMTIDVGPLVQIQDNIGQWRNAESFPPTNANWLPLHLTAEGKLSASSEGTATAVRLMPSTNGAPAQIIELASDPVESDVHISGLPQLSLPFQATGEGGHLGVWMFDADPDGNVRAPSHCPPRTPFPPPCKPREWAPDGVPIIGHAQMNLLYYAGGETRQTMVPGETYTAQIEMEPLDVLLPAGHHLLLWIFQYQYGDHQASMTPAPIDIFLGGDGSVLRLPSIEVDAKTVFPVPGAHFPSRDNLDRMYIAKPVFPPSGPVPLVAESQNPAPACTPTAAVQLVAATRDTNCRLG